MKIKRFAKIVSFFLGPSFTLFPIPYILVSKFTHSSAYALKWTLFSYVFVVAAAFSVSLGVLFGVFTNFDVSKREQRPLLFFLLGLIMLLYFLSIIVIGAPKVLFFGIFALMGSLLILFMVNKWIKVSIHMAVLVSVLILISLAYKGYLFLFLFVPLLAWARVKAKEHTILEVIYGGVLGIMLTFVIYFIGKYLFYLI